LYPLMFVVNPAFNWLYMVVSNNVSCHCSIY
jgi:hypothetical protein